MATGARSRAPARNTARPAVARKGDCAGPAVPNTGAAFGAGGHDKQASRLQPLNRPRQIKVEAEGDGIPLVVLFSGWRIAVEAVVETWRIDDEWWRDKAVSRMYWRVVLEDGRVVDVYRDLLSGKWWRQAY